MTARETYQASHSVDDLATEYFAKALFGEIGSGSPTSSVVFPVPQRVIVDSASAVDVSDRAGRLLGHVTIDNTSITVELGAASLAALETINAVVSGTVAVSNFPVTQAVSGPLTDSQLRATPVPVSGTVTLSGEVEVKNDSGNALSVVPSDIRTLAERMNAKAPATGYTLWLDVTSSDLTNIFIAEAPVGTSAGTANFRGVRISLDALGKPIGAVETATGFAWNGRAAASWVS